MRARFLYLKDPLFLASVGIYILNRFAIRPHLESPGFFHFYLNDLLCIPFWLPPTLLLERMLRVRAHDLPPGPPEIAVHLIVWSVFFEIVGPRLGGFEKSVGDPWDIFWYALGALGAGIVWNVPWSRFRASLRWRRRPWSTTSRRSGWSPGSHP